jgi:hypothetical protein
VKDKLKRKSSPDIAYLRGETLHNLYLSHSFSKKNQKLADASEKLDWLQHLFGRAKKCKQLFSIVFSLKKVIFCLIRPKKH